MAETIGIASGLLTLATFAFQSSVSLYKAIDSYKSNHRIIRELKEELEALNRVLSSLRQTAAKDGADLTALKLPLFGCGKACEDFEGLINKLTAHSGGSRTSFRDWAKLKYMGDDVVGFKHMLAGYKSTINIALGDVNLRTARVTVEILAEYKEMITNTTTDLEDHLQEIDRKLQILSLQGAAASNGEANERDRIQEERDSTKQCLYICDWVSEHLDQIKPNAFEDISTAAGGYREIVSTPGNYIPAKLITTEAFKDCKERLPDTTSQLRKHLQEINKKLQDLPSRGDRLSGDDGIEQGRIQEEKDSLKQCLAICAQASVQVESVRTNVFEDVSAAQDAHQLVVATLGDLISARNVSAAARSTQWLGQMSDASLQQLSRDRNRLAGETAVDSGSAMVGDFQDRHGTGKKLD